MSDTFKAILAMRVFNLPIAADGDRPKETDCYKCKHRRNLDYSHHSLCAEPCAKVTGSRHGIERGWFMYPLNFDPVWRTSECENFEPVDTPQSATQSVEQRS